MYHSQTDKAAVGLAKVVKAGYPDPTDVNGKRVWVDIAPVRALHRMVTLAEVKAEPVFETSPLVRQSRLSVVPLTDEQLADDRPARGKRLDRSSERVSGEVSRAVATRAGRRWPSSRVGTPR